MSKPRLVLAACCVAALFTTSAQAQKSFAPGVLKVIKPVVNGRDAHSLPMALPGISQEYIDQAEKTQWSQHQGRKGGEERGGANAEQMHSHTKLYAHSWS